MHIYFKENENTRIKFFYSIEVGLVKKCYNQFHT